MLELIMHCHYVVAVDDSRLGWPEVSLPVVPGMEACHWPFRRSPRAQWPKLLHMLLAGELVRARDAQGWLIDAAGPLDESLAKAWALASGKEALPKRALEAAALVGVPQTVAGLAAADSAGTEAGRAAIVQCVTQSCAVPAAEALALQARLAAEFLASAACREGRVGAEFTRTMRA
jgi:enoyl-CoA hydratase/carnithine racemase